VSDDGREEIASESGGDHQMDTAAGVEEPVRAKRGRKPSKKEQVEHTKRGANSYQLFMRTHGKRLGKEAKDLGAKRHAHIASAWKSLSEDEKAFYEEGARRERDAIAAAAAAAGGVVGAGQQGDQETGVDLGHQDHQDLGEQEAEEDRGEEGGQVPMEGESSGSRVTEFSSSASSSSSSESSKSSGEGEEGMDE